MTKNEKSEKIDKKEELYEYLRVSTKLQDTDMQKNSNKKYRESHNIIIKRVFEDNAISGALGYEREAFKEMIDTLDEVDGILLYSWSRLSREEEFAVSLMYALRNKGKYVIESSTGNKLDFSQLQSRMLGFFKSVQASEERLTIKRNQKAGIENFIRKHNRWGRLPYYGVNTSGRKLSKESFWQLYEQYRIAKINKSGIARILKMSRNNLYQKLKEDEKQYLEIEIKIKSCGDTETLKN